MRWGGIIRNFSFLSVIIPILVLFVTIYFFLLPAFKKDSLLKQQIRNTNMDLGVVQAPIKEYGALKSDIEARKDQLAAIEKKLFWQKDISKFLNELTRLASDLDIEFVSLKPEQLSIVGQEGGEADLKLVSVPIMVAFRSSYADTIRFLERIEEGERFIRIDALSVEADPRLILKHLTKMKLSIFIKKGG